MELMDCIKAVSSKRLGEIAEAAVSTGGGGFSSVYVLGNFVVKTWRDDAAYEDWLEFCEQRRNDPACTYTEHLPKVLWYSREAKVAIIERLETGFNIGHHKTKSMGTSADFWYYRGTGPDWFKAMIQDMAVEGLLTRHREDMHSYNWMIRKDGRRRVVVITDPLAPKQEP